MDAVLRTYPSLYDSASGAIVAILIGLSIIGALLHVVAMIFRGSQNEHEALTRFVMSMVAVVVGVYVADLLIAGPDTRLLAPSERTTVLAFIKDTCLTVFAYYFGTRSLPPTSVQMPAALSEPTVEPLPDAEPDLTKEKAAPIGKTG